VNGLCGAVIPGVLEITTGLHTGDVPVRIEVHDSEPEIDPAWQEVVEASFRPLVPGVRIGIWADAPMPLPDLEVRDYRVRFCGSGFDNDRAGVTDPPERYLMQFWPSPPAADRVVRQTSGGAAYWHQVAQRTPAPPSAEERATARQRQRAEQERRREQSRREQEARHWGGRWGGRAPDSDSLRDIAPRAVGLARLDRDLVDEIAAAGPDEQRAMAAWAARETCRRAGLAEQAWVAEALDALDRGAAPPPWFATFDDAFARWRGASPDKITHRWAAGFVADKGDRPFQGQLTGGGEAPPADGERQGGDVPGTAFRYRRLAGHVERPEDPCLVPSTQRHLADRCHVLTVDRKPGQKCGPLLGEPGIRAGEIQSVHRERQPAVVADAEGGGRFWCTDLAASRSLRNAAAARAEMRMLVGVP
jgi:hypothetical protein